jgi:hypothetical protein
MMFACGAQERAPGAARDGHGDRLGRKSGSAGVIGAFGGSR